MLSASLSVASADATALGDRSVLWPSLAANAQYVYTEEANSANGSVWTTSSGPLYGFGVSQALFQWGALKHQAEFGNLRSSIARRQYDEAYRSLALSIRSQYLDLIKKKIGLKLIQLQAKSVSDNLALQEARLKDGRISSADIVEPRLQVQEISISVDRASQDFDSSRRMLAHLIGVPEISNSQIPDDIPAPKFEPEKARSFFEKTDADGVQRTLPFLVYKDTIKQDELTYKIQKVRLYPKFNFFANYTQLNQTNVDPSGNPTLTAITVASVGVGANWTIFDGFATRGAIRGALASKRLAEQQMKEYSASTTETLRNLEKQIGFAGRAMNLTETRRTLATASIGKVSNDVKAGVAPQTLLNAVTQNAATANLTAISTRAEFLSLWAQYLSTAGLDPILENLPANYYHHVK